MILLCGIPSEPPLRAVTEALQQIGASYIVFNQRAFERWSISFEVRDGGVDGELRYRARRYDLACIAAVFTRFIDDRVLPEVEGESQDSEIRCKCRSVHDALARWIEVAPALVINRASAMASNSSKPYQSQLISRHGFLIPETLISNNPDAIRAFRRKYGRVIYKSASGVRSIVHELSDEDERRLDLVRWCPTLFQEFIGGTNIRVHIIGGKAFATAVESGATDYRYAMSQTGQSAKLREVELSSDVRRKCVSLAKSLRLEFAGIDLKVTPDDQVYCFEVNPCPAFSYYEMSTGQPIANAIAKHLASAGRIT
jgi:glutathione synthase/RimK-type ligase-like ATP-grasp enzyme